MIDHEFVGELIDWQAELVSELDLALSERPSLVEQIAAAKRIEAAAEAEQRKIEALLVDAVGHQNTTAGSLGRRLADRRRNIARPESPRLAALLGVLDNRISDLRQALDQVARAIRGEKFGDRAVQPALLPALPPPPVITDADIAEVIEFPRGRRGERPELVEAAP